MYGSTLGQSGDQVEPFYSEDPVGNSYSAIVQTVEGYTVAPSLATSSSSLGQTVSFWYRGTGVGNFQQEGTIIRRDRGDGSPVFRIGAADAITMGVEVNGTVQSNSLTFSGQLNAGVWNHIVVVFDYVNDEIRVYQDGFFRNVHPVAGPGFVDMTATGNTYIGRYPNGVTPADNAVPGDLDDVRIFNYALATAEAQDLFTAGR